MTYTVDFKPIADQAGADVLSQADYLTYLAGAGADGYPSGILTKEVLNKTQRQTSVMAAVVANFISENAEQDVLDADDAVTALTLAMKNAVIAAANVVTVGILPPDYLQGLTLSNNVGSPNTYVDIAIGNARDSANAYDMALAAALTKVLQASGSWTAGNNANGLFNGARANSTCYHVFLIRKDADGTIDAGFDTSFTAANKPAGYSNYRRIGSVLTDGSGNIYPFFQFGRTFVWKNVLTDVSQSVANVAAVNVTVRVPTGLSVLAEVVFSGYQGAVGGGYAGGYSILRNPSTADVAAANYDVTGGTGVAGNNAATLMTTKEEVVTNTSGQIGIRALVSYTMNIATLGWTEL